MFNSLSKTCKWDTFNYIAEECFSSCLPPCLQHGKFQLRATHSCRQRQQCMSLRCIFDKDTPAVSTKARCSAHSALRLSSCCSTQQGLPQQGSLAPTPKLPGAGSQPLAGCGSLLLRDWQNPEPSLSPAPGTPGNGWHSAHTEGRTPVRGGRNTLRNLCSLGKKFVQDCWTGRKSFTGKMMDSDVRPNTQAELNQQLLMRALCF